MYSSGSSVFAVNAPARALAAQRGSRDRNRFLVGTCSLHDENYLHVLEYREDGNQLDQVGLYGHADQIYSIESAPRKPEQCITCDMNKSGTYAVKLWQMPGQTESDIEGQDVNTPFDGSVSTLDELAAVKNIDIYSSHHVAWHSTRDQVALTSAAYVAHTSISESSMEVVQKISVEEGIEIDLEQTLIGNGVTVYDPHSPSSSASSFGKNIHIVDWRSSEVTNKILGAHTDTIRDIDYNPNKPMHLLSCGDDLSLRFWDLRSSHRPLVTLSGHTHWVWSAKYNPFHDQLILSGGSDNIVNLWRVASISSAPWLAMDSSSADNQDAYVLNNSGSYTDIHGHDDDGNGNHHDSNNNINSSSSHNHNKNSNGDSSSDPADVKVRSIDQHEESVYNVMWSASDAWIFATMSYDGRIVVNHVPSTEKYKILL